ncbi:MAG: response regulator [Desulfobaccales bacterium]
MTNKKILEEILIVEDSSTQSERLRYVLEQHGYRVSMAGNGREAMDLLANHKPNLVISDILMPEADGYEVCRFVRQHRDLQNVPVILLTALSDPVDVMRALECGADNFLMKPFEENQLLERVRLFLLNRDLLKPEGVQEGLEIVFQGQKYFINADRLQILNLLLSTYEAAVEKNSQLLKAQTELQSQAEELETQSEELRVQNDELRDLAEALQKSENGTQRQAQILAGINRIFHEALTDETEEKLGETCLAVAEELTGSRFGFICEVNQAGRFDTIAVSNPGWRACKIPISEAMRLLYDAPVCGIRRKVIETGEPLLCNDPPSHPDYVVPPEGHPPITAFLGVPLKHAGKTIGMIALGNKAGGYTDADRGAMEALAPAIMEAFMRKRAEEALKDSEERFRTMANAIPQLAWTARSDGYISWYNQRWYDYTGTIPEDMEGWGWQSVHNPEVLPKVLEQWRASLATGRPFDMVFPLRGKDGQFRQFLTRVMPMKGADGQVIQWFGTNTDITDRKLAEKALKQAHDELEQRVKDRTADLRLTVAQLQEEVTNRLQAEASLKESEGRLRHLTSQLLTAQEAERGRLALELHDDLGQSLTVLKMQLRTIQRKAPPESSETRVSLEHALNFINEVIEKIRHLSRNLRPTILEDLGLTGALKYLFEDFSNQGILVTMNLDDIQGLFSQETQLIIYRIFQESFSNITKYAQASQVSLSIKRQDGSVAFQLEDNGRGFDHQKVINENITDRGLGLTSMNERARMVGGSFNIWSQEGQGTKMTLVVPIQVK